MPIPREVPFTAFDFSDEELQHSLPFNLIQRQYLQTMLSEVACRKLAEAFDAEKPVQFAQMEAYSRGQMDLLNVLLGDKVFDVPENPYDAPEQDPNAAPTTVTPTT